MTRKTILYTICSVECAAPRVPPGMPGTRWIQAAVPLHFGLHRLSYRSSDKGAASERCGRVREMRWPPPPNEAQGSDVYHPEEAGPPIASRLQPRPDDHETIGVSDRRVSPSVTLSPLSFDGQDDEER